MGTNSSKPSPDPPPHVWKGSSATGVSQNIVDSLQSSSETDTSRAQTLELQIQARVADELRRLQAKENASLQQAREKLSESDPAGEKDDNKVSSQAVSKEVDALRAQLEKRKKVRDVPASVETARSEVVRCLRENDRRPLDCWKEVEAFKNEVRRLEDEWVKKVME